MLGVEIVFFQLDAAYKNFAISQLNSFTGQADDAFYIAFIGIIRKPKNDYIAAIEVAPTDALDLVIDQLIDQQAFAVVKLRQHRGALDNDRLHKKHTEKYENDNNQENIAK